MFPRSVKGWFGVFPRFAKPGTNKIAMADDGSGFSILKDLQLHLRTANFPVENLSTLAREGDERVIIMSFLS